jgi:hypothetical protein
MIDYDMMLEENKKYLYAGEKDVKAFMDLKFGVFIHWNPSCLIEAEISWSRFGPRGTEEKAQGGIPVDEYDNLYKKFNPVKFDAEEWVKMVKDSGAKYMIFTTKHHDGFCMFDAPNTEYKITNTPFKRDICKELADSCHKHDIKLFWYFSKPDWKHPDYLTENQDKCCDYIHEHLRFLLSNYGKIDGLWFDCLGTSWKDWRTPEMVKMIRELQPHILINQRWGWGMDAVDYQGDFDLAEQEIGEFNIERAWESSITMAHGWSWSGESPLKPVGTCLHVLLRSVGAGGNFALNTGPKPDGTINQPEVKQYLEIGKWLKENGEYIYDTNAGPYKPGPWGVATNDGNRIFLHVLSKYSEGSEKVLKLPALPYKVESCFDIQGDELEFSSDSKCFIVSLGEINEIDTIIVVKLAEKLPEDYQIIDTESEYTIYNPVKALASSSKDEEHSASAFMQEGNAEFQAGIHHKKHWAPEFDDKNSSLILEFDKKIDFDTVQVSENIWSICVKDFELDYRNEAGDWECFYKGKEIGLDFAVKTSLIHTDAVRLKIHELLPNTQTGITVFDIRKNKN